MQIPHNSSSTTYTITAAPFLPQSYETSSVVFPGENTAEISFDPTLRSFQITSSILTNAVNIEALSIEERKAASNDILSTLSAFAVEIGPKHTSENGSINCIFTTLDVNVGSFSERDNPFSHEIIVFAVADVSSKFDEAKKKTLIFLTVFLFRHFRNLVSSLTAQRQLTKTPIAFLSS